MERSESVVASFETDIGVVQYKLDFLDVMGIRYAEKQFRKKDDIDSISFIYYGQLDIENRNLSYVDIRLVVYRSGLIQITFKEKYSEESFTVEIEY
jgi:hypothetical protein